MSCYTQGGSERIEILGIARKHAGMKTLMTSYKRCDVSLTIESFVTVCRLYEGRRT